MSFPSNFLFWWGERFGFLCVFCGFWFWGFFASLFVRLIYQHNTIFTVENSIFCAIEVLSLWPPCTRAYVTLQDTNKNRDRLLSNKMTPLLEFPISFFVKFFTYRVWLSFKYQYENIRETLQLHKERSTLHWVDKRFAAEIVRRLTIVSL